MTLYTETSLASSLNCSKTVLRKHLARISDLVTTSTLVNGRTVKAYDIDNDLYNSLSSLIQNNKQIVTSSLPTINRVIEEVAQSEDWQKKYYETKSMLDVQLNQVKLITDREAEALNQNKSLNKELASKSEEIGTLKATVQLYQSQNSIKNKVIIALSSLLVAGVIALLIKLILI